MFYEPGFLVVVTAGGIRENSLELICVPIIGEELSKYGVTPVGSVHRSCFHQEKRFGVVRARKDHCG